VVGADERFFFFIDSVILNEVFMTFCSPPPPPHDFKVAHCGSPPRELQYIIYVISIWVQLYVIRVVDSVSSVDNIVDMTHTRVQAFLFLAQSTGESFN
jgi:hypothetical protein